MEMGLSYLTTGHFEILVKLKTQILNCVFRFYTKLKPPVLYPGLSVGHFWIIVIRLIPNQALEIERTCE